MRPDLPHAEGPVPIAGAILRLLAGPARQRMVALLITRGQRGRLHIEEACPHDRWTGETIAAPPGLCDDAPCLRETRDGRLPLAWTELCGARPVAIAAVPLGEAGRFLICASAHAQPDLELMAGAADTILRVQGVGPLTTQEYQSSKDLDSLVNNLPIPLIYVDSRAIEVFLNDPARALLDIPRGTLTNRQIAAKLARLAVEGHGPARGRELAKDPFADLGFEIERDGRTHKIESKWVDDGVLLGRIWMFRDVTEERVSARMKDQLVATVSHELRTPLTAIIGSLGLMQAGAAGTLTEQGSKLVTMARRNGDRLVKIVNDLLDMEKMQSGKITYDFAPLDLAVLIEEAIAQNHAYTESFGVQVRAELPERPVIVRADETRITQVLTNLISNAAKFSPRSSTVRVTLGQRGNFARISVIDEGRGISEEFRAHLFARFSQDRESAVTGHPGSGLGLAISRGIVEAHGGTIGLDESTTIGSTFHVDLPLP